MSDDTLHHVIRWNVVISKTTTMHDVVIGLFINRYEFGVAL